MSLRLLRAARLAVLAPLYASLVVESLREIAVALLGLALIAPALSGKPEDRSTANRFVDVLADRLLNLTVTLGLVANGTIAGPWIVPGLVLIASDVVAASLGPMADRENGRANLPERLKLLGGVGASLCLVPPQSMWLHPLQGDVGRWALCLAAVFAAVVVAARVRRATPRAS